MKFKALNRILKFFYIALFITFIHNSIHTADWLPGTTWIPNDGQTYYWTGNASSTASVTIIGKAVVTGTWTQGTGRWLTVDAPGQVLCVGSMQCRDVCGFRSGTKFEIAKTGSLSITSGYLAMRGGSPLYNYGGTINVNALIHLDTGPLNIWNGTVNVGTGGIIAADGPINIGYGLLDIKASGTLENATVAARDRTITVTGGELKISGGQLLNGFNATGNIAISNNGKFTVDTGYLYNGASKGSGNISMSAGNLNFNSNALIYNGYSQPGSISVSGGTFLSTTTLKIGTKGAGTGSLTISGAGNVNLYKSRCEIGRSTASGILNLNAGSLTYSGTVYVSNGSLNISGANLSVPSGSNLINCANGVINVSANRTLTIDGTFNNAGNINTSSPCSINIGAASDGILTSTSGTMTFNGVALKLGGNSSSGTANLNGGATTYSGDITIAKGAFNLNNTNLTIPSGSSIANLDNGTLLINTGRILTNNGILLNSGIFTNLGTYLNNGPTVDTKNEFCVMPPGYSLTIPNGTTLSIPETNTFFLNGILNNLSNSSINVSGNLFVNNTLNNGGASAGTINVNGTGKVFVVGGSIINGNVGSAINVNRGGIINNYYGIINTTQGSFSINSGGRFYNVRGNYPANITFNAGSSGLESDEVYLTENLSLDYTWTITNKAVINGQGHVITFNSTNGIIKVTKNASLLLRDVVIKNVSANQIRCLDTYSTLSLDKCTWLLDGNFSFTKGRMYISGDCNIVGNNHSFSYQSRKESSLAEDANLNIVDTTFIYDIAISNTLFNPLSSTSNICLQNSTLQASQSWKPGAGTIFTAGNVTLNGIATLNLQNISKIQNHGSITRLGTVLM